MTNRTFLIVLAATSMALLFGWSQPAAANVTLQACSSASTIVEPDQIVVAYWTTDASDDVNDELDFDLDFLRGTVGSPYDGMLEQYYQGSGTAPSCSNNDQYSINAVGSGGFVNAGRITGAIRNDQFTDCTAEEMFVDGLAGPWHTNNVYVVQLGPNAQYNCNTDNPPPCAYPRITKAGHKYMIIPYQSGSGPFCRGNAKTVYDMLGQSLHHEYGELITDSDGKSGWRNGNSEIGDLCQNPVRTISPVRYVQFAPSGTSPATRAQTQQLWSNGANRGNGACVWTDNPYWETFYLGIDGAIWRQPDGLPYAKSWGTPQTPFASGPAVATWGGGRIDLFAVDQNVHLGHLYQRWDGDSVGWDDWSYPSGGFYYKPAVTSWGNSRLDVFATNSQVFHRSWDNGSDSGWVNLGTPGTGVQSAPAAVSGFWNPSNSNPQLDVFVLGGWTDGNTYLFESSSTDGTNFSAWKNLGRQTNVTFVSSPTVASWGPNDDANPTGLREDVFILNSAGSLSHFYLTKSGSGNDVWSPPSGVTLTGDPTAMSRGDETLFVVGVTTSGYLVNWYWIWGSFTSSVDNVYFDPVQSATAATPWHNVWN